MTWNICKWIMIVTLSTQIHDDLELATLHYDIKYYYKQSTLW